MNSREVRTQAELDKALKDGVDIDIRGDGAFVVTAYDSATVTAYDSATVTASDSATVRAYDSATVRAYGSATVTAGACVPVQDHGPNVKITGGVVIPIRRPETIDDWCAYYTVPVSRGWATVYKGVADDLTSGYGFAYPVGKEVACPDWKPTDTCGNGLHFSAHAFMTENYCTPERYLEVRVKVSECVVLGDKIKAPRCKVIREVTADGGSS